MIKLLIVDDSALVRKHMRRIFEAEGDFELKTCKDGKQAVEELHRFEPDVIALDINMPVMDGLTALSYIMVERPTPVVMVSSLTEQGAMATLESLALGAVDFVTKPGGTISVSLTLIEQELVTKIRSAARAHLRDKSERLSKKIKREFKASQARPAKKRGSDQDEKVVLIGVSTGGPRALEEILPFLPVDFPWPVVVAQHMPASFTAPFADRMDSMSALKVVEVSRPMQVCKGHIYIAKGGGDLTFSKRSKGMYMTPRPEHKDYLWHPSVDLMVNSAMRHYDPKNVIGVLLTGMGYDGAASMTSLLKKGGRTIAESEESCVVFGMSAVLIENRGAKAVLPVDQVADKLIAWVR